MIWVFIAAAVVLIVAAIAWGKLSDDERKGK